MATPRAVVEVARTIEVLAAAPPAFDWLSDSERARLDTLRHAGRRDHYLAGHWLARVLLARAFGHEPMHWSLTERRSLPPHVHGHEDALHVSLSHAGEWVAAVVADAPVGIDIESRDRVLDAALEPLLLEPGEARGSLDAEALLGRWVAKEAWIKREAGIALPAQFAGLRLREVPRAQADVHLASLDGLHLALAWPAHAGLEHDDVGPLRAGIGYAVAGNQFTHDS
jgi:4'-phosphopantetheinyl transferase